VRSVPGKGSRFSLYLPVLDGTALAAARPAASGEPGTGRPLRVLSVDDDERIVEASGLLIERLGHHALVAQDIAGALAAGESIDAALVDYQLGGGESGLDLIERLRARDPQLPVLLVTAESNPELRARAAAMQVEILSKPAAPGAIEAFLSAVSVREIEPE
jgi:DNA-binding response OmpR family regulator